MSAAVGGVTESHLGARAEPAAQSVPFVALGRQHAALKQRLAQAFERVLEADAFILGEEVEAFEREFARYCGARARIGVASGTAALGLALIAAGVGPGDEVIVPGHTFIASALGVLHAGATPVFCDVEPDTGLIDPEAAAAVVGPRTAAIVPVHLYGQMCDMPRICALAARHGLFVLEDAAQAHGATCEGARAGSWGDAAAFSFYPSKNLGALGDGGAVCTDDQELAQRVAQLRHLGQRSKGEHVLAGFNERLDGLQAALLRVKLPHLDGWNAARRQHARTLHAALAGRLGLLAERPWTPCVYHLFPVRHEARERMVELLRRAGIHVGLHYTPAAHRHPAFEHLPRTATPLELPNAERWAAEEFSLPMFPELGEHELELICSACLTACEMAEAGRVG